MKKQEPTAYITSLCHLYILMADLHAGIGRSILQKHDSLGVFKYIRQRDNDWHMKIITIEFLVTNHILFALNTYTVHEDTNVT